MFLSVSFWIALLIFALGTISPIHNFSRFSGVILPVQINHKILTSHCIPLPSPIYNIIVLNILSIYIWDHIRKWYNFCFNHQYNCEDSRREGKPVVITPIFAYHVLPSFFYCFVFVWRTSFSYCF